MISEGWLVLIVEEEVLLYEFGLGVEFVRDSAVVISLGIVPNLVIVELFWVVILRTAFVDISCEIALVPLRSSSRIRTVPSYCLRRRIPSI